VALDSDDGCDAASSSLGSTFSAFASHVLTMLLLLSLSRGIGAGEAKDGCKLMGESGVRPAAPIPPPAPHIDPAPVGVVGVADCGQVDVPPPRGGGGGIGLAGTGAAACREVARVQTDEPGAGEPRAAATPPTAARPTARAAPEAGVRSRTGRGGSRGWSRRAAASPLTAWAARPTAQAVSGRAAGPTAPGLSQHQAGSLRHLHRRGCAAGSETARQPPPRVRRPPRIQRRRRLRCPAAAASYILSFGRTFWARGH
jgi:hypothetical protein